MALVMRAIAEGKSLTAVALEAGFSVPRTSAVRSSGCSVCRPVR